MIRFRATALFVCLLTGSMPGYLAADEPVFDSAASPAPLAGASTVPDPASMPGDHSISAGSSAPAVYPETGKQSGKVDGIPIDSGNVVFKGEMLESPFTVSREAGRVLINDHPVASFGERGRNAGPHARRLAVNIERRLIYCEWVLVFEENVVAFTDEFTAVELFAAFQDSSSITDRVWSVMEYELRGTGSITTAEWKRALTDLEAGEGLQEWIATYAVDNDRGTDTSAEAASGPPPVSISNRTRIMYGLSVVGMILIALSAGTLMRHPPKTSGRWSQIIRSRRTHCMVKRCLILIAAYSVFDLTATLMAGRTGRFEELNPVGATLLLAPAALALFKLVATCLGTGLLWRLKDYHGAQLASWWLCMILTLVTVRWVTVQSLFFV